MKRIVVTLAGLVSLCFLYACDNRDGRSEPLAEKRLTDAELATLPAKAENNNVLVFGFDLRSSPQEDARQYLPFLKYLEKTTGYKFKLRFTPEDGKIVDDLGKGVVQLAAIGATSYIQAHEKYGVVPLVRGMNLKGKAEYRSMLVVRHASPIRTLSDLYGKKFAFGSKTSTQGHLIPRIILRQHNLSLADLDSYKYTGSHQNCADAVISGRFDVCGLYHSLPDLTADALPVHRFVLSSQAHSESCEYASDYEKRYLV